MPSSDLNVSPTHPRDRKCHSYIISWFGKGVAKGMSSVMVYDAQDPILIMSTMGLP